MSAAVDVNTSSDSFSGENSSTGDGGEADTTTQRSGPPSRNIFCAMRGVPRLSQESSSMSSSSSSEGAMRPWRYTEQSELSYTEEEEESGSESGQSVENVPACEKSANPAVLPLMSQNVSESSDDEDFITPPSPTAVLRDAENFGIQEELLCKSDEDEENASVDTTQSVTLHRNADFSDCESVTLPSPTEVSREAENFRIEEIEFSEEKSESEDNGNDTSVTDASLSSPTYIVELPDEDDTSELSDKNTRLGSLSPTAVLNESADLGIDDEEYSEKECECEQDMDNLDVADISKDDPNLASPQNAIENDEIVIPPSPTDVSRDAENLGITGTTDMEVKTESEDEEKCNNSANVSNDSSSKLIVESTIYNVDSGNNVETSASKADITGNLMKFLEEVLKITPDDSHKFILHNTMSLAFFIKTQLQNTENFEQAHELVKEVGCLLKRLKN